MATQVQNRRGSTAEHSTFTGAVGEVTVDTDKEVVVVHDGTTAGGYPQMRENGSNSALALGSAATPSLKFTGDTNTGIYSPGADQLAISTNGTGRLFVGSSGNIGLGTSSPTAFVQSNGSVKINAENSYFTIDADTNDRLGFVKKAGATPIFAAGSATSFIFGHSSGSTISDPTNQTFSERLRITSAGLVGIGTSSPGTILDTRGFASYRGNVFTVASFAANNTAPPLNICQGNDGTHPSISAGQNSTGTFAPLGFLTSEQYRMLITNDGKVGIGTTSPSETLHVNGNARSSHFLSQGYFVGQGNLSTADARSGFTGIGPSSSTSPGDFYGAYSYFYGATHNTRPGDIEFGTGLNTSGSIQFKINTTERARIDSSGRLLVGTSSARSNFYNSTATSLLQIEGTGGGGSSSQASFALVNNSSSAGDSPYLLIGRSKGSTIGSNTVVSSGDSIGRVSFQASDGAEFVEAATIESFVDAAPGSNDMPGRLVFSTTADGQASPTEALRIGRDRGVSIGGESGSMISSGGYLYVQKQSDKVAFFNRNTDDGIIVELRQDNTAEGSISVSGTTVSYNGAHLSRWSQIPGIDPYDKTVRPEILRGTVMSNLDEMCEWCCPESGEAQDNEQLNKTKISDVEGDKNVAGVFQSWDDDDDTWVNDFYLAMTGDFIIRIGAGVTVERGDLLMSAGDGTAKPQDDDIIRSKTIAKVTSTNVSCTYEDGSYCVPCVLMAC